VEMYSAISSLERSLAHTSRLWPQSNPDCGPWTQEDKAVGGHDFRQSPLCSARKAQRTSLEVASEWADKDAVGEVFVDVLERERGAGDGNGVRTEDQPVSAASIRSGET